MRAIVLSAKTGNGHNAVMKALYSFWDNEMMEIELFPSFYEDILPSNRVLSDFYNLLQVKSFRMCKEYTEMSILKSVKGIMDSYSIWKEALNNFFKQVRCDVIISTTPLINQYIILYLKEFSIEKKFYIIVTDPYNPIYPGFAVEGATGYFVANNLVKNILVQEGIEESKVFVCGGYPLGKQFTEKRNNDLLIDSLHNYYKEKQTILINCGSQGSFHFLKIIKKICELYYDTKNIIVICGSNKTLYNICKKRFNVIVLGFVDYISDLLSKSDICITKAGANTIYECIYMGIPLLIDGTRGYLYQEEGIKSFLKKKKIGECFEDVLELEFKIKNILEPSNLSKYKKNILEMNTNNGTPYILKKIWNSTMED